MQDLLASGVKHIKNCFSANVSGYLFGSYLEEQHLALSDIDLLICFNEHENELEFLKYFQQCEKETKKLFPTFSLQALSLSASTRIPIEMTHSKLIFGKDLLQGYFTETFNEYLTRAAQAVCTCITWLHFLEARQINYPLKYPKQNDYYYGYLNANTRLLVSLNLYIARFLLAYEQKIMTHSKKSSYEIYLKTFQNEWSDHIAEVYRFCKDTWKYEIPGNFQAQSRLKKICRKTLLFENLFLTKLRSLLIQNPELITANKINLIR